jgi:hypothetical protein
MSVQMILNLHDITLRKLQESTQDEIYVIGGVKVSRAGSPVPAKSKSFYSRNITTFTNADKGIERTLNPQGEAYNEILEDDEIALVNIWVIEHDAASTVQDITGELRDFLDEVDMSDILEHTPLASGGDLAKILMGFIDTLSNIFDKDDILAQWSTKYRMDSIINRIMIPKKISIWHHDISFVADMDSALYEPVTATAHFIKI